MQVVPDVHATARWTKSRQTKFGAVLLSQGLVGVELGDVVTGHNHGDLEGTEVGVTEIVHGAAGRGVGAFAAQCVVGLGVNSINRDLNIEIVHRGETLGRFGRNA